MSPFVEACSGGAVQEVKLLLGQGAAVAEQDSAVSHAACQHSSLLDAALP